MTTEHPSAVPYKDFLNEQLQDKTLAIAYLNESLNEEEDLSMFLVALRNVIDAQGIQMTSISRSTGLSRENLYKMLSTKGNPEWKSLKVILNSLGYQLTIAG